MVTSLQDAWKSWRSARAVMVLAAAALAVGIGATTAVFTVVNAVMLKPIEYVHGDRFGVLFGAQRGGGPNDRSSLTFADVVRYSRETRSFDVFGWYRPETYTLTAPGSPRHVQGAAVTTSLAHHLGVDPLIGRWFDDEHGAVISSALWESLGGSRELVDRPIVLNGRALTIVGVMPPRFRLPEIGHSGNDVRTDVWTALDSTGRTPESQQGFFFAYARLKPGITFSEADADVKRVATLIAQADPLSHPGYTGRFDSLQSLIVEGVRPTLLVLLGSASLLFLIGCANVAALLLSRAVARTRDIAVRVAIGASLRQLARQFFAESLLVSGIGAAAGIALSVILVKLTVGIASELIPRADDVRIDWHVLLFTLSVGVLASGLSSLAPLWHASRTHPNESLTDGVRSTPGARGRRLSASLVVGELALAFALLSLGAVLLVTVNRLLHVQPGFETDHLLSFQMTLPDALAGDDTRRVQQQIRFVDALKALPGVQAVGISNQTPMDGCCLSTALYPDGQTADLSVPQKVSFLGVNPQYFAALRVPLRRGRLLEYSAASGDVLPVVINEAASRRYWPGRDPVGASGHIGRPDGSRFRVLGVVGDVRNDGLDKPTVPEVYLLHSAVAINPFHVLLRSTLPDQTLLPQVRRAVMQVDPEQPIHDEATMARIVLTSLALPRLASAMTAFFAGAALVLAVLGVYGIMAYSVRQRTVEFGTRMALGALGSDLIRLVMGQGLKLAAAGLAAGAAILAVGWNSSGQALQLPAIEWTPLVIAMATTFLLVATASMVPAWRAARLSPMVAMRETAESPNLRGMRVGVRSRLSSWSRRLTTITTVAENGELPSALFVDATRRAASTHEALDLALATLVTKLDVAWAMLVEPQDGAFRYRRAAADGQATQGEVAARGFLANRLQSHDGPFPVTPGDLDAWVIWASQERQEYLPEIVALRHEGVRLAVALRSQRVITAFLLLGSPPGGRPFTSTERHALRQSAHQLSLMLENSRLTSRILEQEVLRRDLALAAEVQRRLLPAQPPPRASVSLAAFTIAARNVAGDYYDFLEIGDQRLGIALADVSGKGVAAALIMSVVQASLRIIASDEHVPLDLLAARMNQYLYRSTQSGSYATFFYAQLDERTRRMEFVNAGHNPPLLVRRSPGGDESAPAIVELTTGGMVLGLFPEVAYQREVVQLQSGDVLFLFSDGVPESLNVRGDEFGLERVQAILITHRDQTVETIAARMSQAIGAWAAGTAQYDDITFIVMKVT